MTVRPLDFDRTLEDSRRVNGALGVLAYALAKALQVGGAPDEEVEKTVSLMKKHFPRLSDQDCNTLSRVVFERMAEDKQAKGGRWY
jgi:hypothetical protein